MLRGLGYFLGFLVGGMIITLVINLVFFNHPSISEKEINKFIANSEVIKDEMKRRKRTKEEIYAAAESNEKYDLGTNYKHVRMSYSRSGGGTLRYMILIYYSPKYKKHFGLLPVGEGGKALDRVPDMDYYLTVNKDQMNDPAYGGLQNPIPVLDFRGITESLRENNIDFDAKEMERRYRKNIDFYLSFLMPKEEFYKMFPEKRTFWDKLLNK